MNRRRTLDLCRRLIILSSCGLCFLPSVTNAASTIGVVDEAQNAADQMRGAAEEIANYHKNLEYVAVAEQECQKSKEYLDLTQSKIVAAEKAMTEAKALLSGAENRLREAEMAAKAKQEIASQAAAEEVWVRSEIANASTELAQAKSAQRYQSNAQAASLKALRAKIEAEQETAAARILEEIGYDEARYEEAAERLQNTLDSYEASLEAAESDFEAKEIAADARIERAEERIDAAQERLDLLLEHQEAAVDAAEDAKDAKDAWLDAGDGVSDAEDAILDAEENAAAAKEELDAWLLDLEDAKKQLEPIEESRFFQGRDRYYTWKSADGRTGYQYYAPFDFYLRKGEWDFGLQTGYVVSNNRSVAGGAVSTLDDTTLHIAKRNEKKKYAVSYELDINVPTGKSSLNNQAIMPDDLVERSRFGEGWNYTPGIVVRHKIGEEDTWTFGTSYAIRGSYEYDEGLPGAKIYPGNEWAKSLEWLHAGQKWQMLAKVSHSNYAVTEENRIKYREGQQTDLALYYNRTLTPTQDLFFYYRYAIGGKANYLLSEQDVAGGNLYERYFGTQWQCKMPGGTLRVMLNGMNSTGKNYDPLTTLETNGRTKYGGRIGYDIDLPDGTLSFDIERFRLRDKTGQNSYHGSNFFIKYAKSF